MSDIKLVTMSRREIEAHAFETPSIAICIAYPTGRLHKVFALGHLRAVHHTRFSDCDDRGVWTFPENKDMEAKAIPMTLGQGLDIVNFVREQMRQHADLDTIYVACFGGVSRSRGVAAGLAVRFGWDDTAIYSGGHPNVHCKSMVWQGGNL